jgi:glycosyltransferase involved in cell wall biosynthesis
MYRSHDALLFPSLRDSAGLTVLESLCRGLPVIGLALGGTAGMVNHTCGRVVDVEGLNEGACVEGLADAIIDVATTEGLSVSLSRGAIARAKDYSWPLVVARVYTEIEKEFNVSLRSGSQAPGHCASSALA